MKNIFIVLLIALTGFGCESKLKKTERKDEPEIYGFKSDDNSINDAILQARANLPEFFAALKDSSGTITDYYVKQRFETPEAGEHVWLTNITEKDGKLYGTINNEPYYMKEHKLGDEVLIDTNSISDWYYVKNDTLVGGYTIRKVRDRMTEEERKAFDNDVKYIIK